MSAAAQIGRVMRAIPPMAYVAAGGVLLVYLATRKLFEGGAAGFGEAVGRGVAGVASGAAVGTATAASTVAGTLAAEIIKAPGTIIDTALTSLTGSETFTLRGAGEFIGGKLADFFLPYDPNAPNTPAVRRAAQASSPVAPQDKVSVYGTVN